jgi:hypothetical protein
LKIPVSLFEERLKSSRWVIWPISVGMVPLRLCPLKLSDTRPANSPSSVGKVPLGFSDKINKMNGTNESDIIVATYPGKGSNKYRIVDAPLANV